MKHFQLVTLIIIIAGLFSCKKDEPADLLLGNWKATKLVNSGCTDPEDNQNLTFTNGCYSEALLGFEICLSATFNDNGTYSIVTKSTFLGSTDTETENGTYTVSGTTLTLCETGSSCDDANFSVSEKTLSLTGKDTDTNCTSALTFAK